MRACELADRLGTQAEAVARMLLPHGQKRGSEWKCGSVHDEPGDSLGVRLTGTKAGVWSDFSTGETGDLIGLWMATRSLNLHDACREAAEFLGVPNDRPEHRQRTYRKPDREGVHRLTPEHAAWLRDVRKLPDATVEAYRLASRGDRLMFPYLRGNDLVFAKYRKLPKQFSADADCEPILFGWQAIKPDARAVILAEGECFPPDAQVLTRDGWVALGEYRSGQVAQYRDGVIEWVNPLARIRKSFRGDLLRYASRGYTSITTPDHNLVSIDHAGRLYKHSAERGANSVADLIPRVGLLDGAGIALTDAQIRFCIAVSADAAIDQRKHVERDGTGGVVACESRYARFGFRKHRKVERLRSLILDCGLHASDHAIAGGYQSMCMGIPDWVPGRLLPWSWIAEATEAQREMILAELVHWDGNSVPDRNQSEYSSKHLRNAEWVQALAHTTGRVSSIIRRRNDHGAWFKVSILHSKRTSSWQSMKGRAQPVPYDGDVYCVQVPSGMLVVRQEEHITITGNCDALAWHAYGYPALSVPTGATGHAWIEAEYERLEVFDTIYLSFDSDEPGRKGVAELCERLGRERCRVVTLPHKDANECLMQGIPRETMTRALRDARTLDPAELRNIGEFEDEIVAEMSRVDEGMQLPWRKTHGRLQLRAGELSVWAGINGHGKSQIASQIAAHQAVHGTRCCVASMEWRTPKWALRMQRQIGAVEAPTEQYSRTITRALSASLWTFHVAGSAKASRIIEVFRYARRRYRIELFLIDNLTKCGFADDDYAGQKQFVEALSDFARETDCHVMLIAHMRKGESEDRPSGKFGVKGSGGITDMAPTVVEIWRNKARERAREFAEAHKLPLAEEFADGGKRGMDAQLIVHKQNETGDEPLFNLWFDRRTGQFLAQAHHTSRAMLPLVGLATAGNAA